MEHATAPSSCVRASEGCKSVTKYKTDTTLCLLQIQPVHSPNKLGTVLQPPPFLPFPSPDNFPLSRALPSAPSPQGSTSNSLALEQMTRKGV